MSTVQGLVLQTQSEFYTITTNDGPLIEAHLRGRMKKDR